VPDPPLGLPFGRAGLGADLDAAEFADLLSFLVFAVLRHASITTTGNVYVQVVEENVMRAANSHASTVLEGWTPAVESMGLTGRNVKRLAEPFSGSGSNSVKFMEGGVSSG
jgi:hypothetical protein